MQPTEWAAEWQYPLVLLNQQAARLPATAREFLANFGLPRVMIFDWQHPFEISFAVLEKDLVDYAKEMKWGDFYNAELDQDWQQQIIIGEEEFCNGHASFCVHEITGAVNRIDCEISAPNCYVNSDVERFGASLLAAKKWSDTVHAGDASPLTIAFEALSKELEQIDSSAFADQHYYWPNLIEVWQEDSDNLGLELVITNDPAKSEPRF